MVSPLSILCMTISLALVILFPTILALMMWRRYRISWLAVLVGAVVFLVFQVLTRIPLLTVLAQTAWYQQMAENIFLVALFLGFSAGIFEEIGRWLGIRFLLIGRWQTKNGVAYGIGHGGFEAIFLIGLTYLNNLIISIMINTGIYDTLIAPQAGPMADTIKSRLVETPPYLFLVGGLERVLAIIFHIGLSVLVLNAVRLRRPLYLLYAILLHGIVNLVAVMLSQQPNIGIWLSEGFMVLVAVVTYLYIRREWQKRDPLVWPPAEAAVTEAADTEAAGGESAGGKPAGGKLAGGEAAGAEAAGEDAADAEEDPFEG